MDSVLFCVLGAAQEAERQAILANLEAANEVRLFIFLFIYEVVCTYIVTMFGYYINVL